MEETLVGKRFGGYQILQEIGRGGMAVVYKAQQISMNRVVAVKILPRQFLHDQTFRARFRREVDIVAKLAHRAIVPVHDYGEVDEMPYIVMRYMEAGSVDDLLEHGPLPPDQVEPIVRQIAPGLDYAHHKGVLHRDLKPSNILLDENGDAYLTDFGIARIIGGGSTITTSGVVGTPSYMSPEQAQGLKLDGRSDVYGLAVVIFEMLAGQRPYQSDTPYSVAVMHVTAPVPSIRDVKADLSEAVDRVIRRAMAKNREERFPTAVALAEALTEAIQTPESHVAITRPIILSQQAPPPSIEEAPVRAPVRQPQQPPPRSQQPTPPSSGRVSVLAPPMAAPPLAEARRRRRPWWINLIWGGLAGLIVFVVLFVLLASLLSLGAVESTPTLTPTASSVPITTVPLGLHPASISLTATAEAALTLRPPPTAAATGTNEEDATGTPLSAAPTFRQATATPGDSTPALAARATESGPEGGRLVFYSDRDGDDDLYLLDLETGRETLLTENDANDRYPAVSPDGERIAFISDRDGDAEVWLMDLNGDNPRQLTRNNVEERAPAWTPDGQFILFSSDINFDSNHDLYRVAPDGDDLFRLTDSANRDSHPSASPDGRYIAYNSGDPNDPETWEIYRLDLQTGDIERLTDNDRNDWSPTYSPDGSLIAFHRRGEGRAALWVMDANGLDERLVFDGEGYEWGSSWSPDGRRLAFTSDASGDNEIYLLTLENGQVRQITQEGGSYPSWVP